MKTLFFHALLLWLTAVVFACALFTTRFVSLLFLWGIPSSFCAVVFLWLKTDIWLFSKHACVFSVFEPLFFMLVSVLVLGFWVCFSCFFGGRGGGGVLFLLLQGFGVTSHHTYPSFFWLVVVFFLSFVWLRKSLHWDRHQDTADLPLPNRIISGSGKSGTFCGSMSLQGESN